MVIRPIALLAIGRLQHYLTQLDRYVIGRIVPLFALVIMIKRTNTAHLSLTMTTTTFNYTGVTQTLTVPPGATSVVINAIGGTGGAGGSGSPGGSGANISATILLPANTITLAINVGQGGAAGTNGAVPGAPGGNSGAPAFAGRGGSGAASATPAPGTGGGGGGGCSVVYVFTSASFQGSPLIMAAGGGGGAGGPIATVAGGDAGALDSKRNSSGTAGDSSPDGSGAQGGGGGTTVGDVAIGGAGGTSGGILAPGTAGSAGTTGLGGAPGNGGDGASGATNAAGGGGGFGAGGGGGASSDPTLSSAGGGGGSSWVIAGSTNISTGPANTAGDGHITITINVPPPITITKQPITAVLGATVNLMITVTNPASTTVSNIDVIDELPPQLIPGFTGTLPGCGSSTITEGKIGGQDIIAITGITLAAGATCSFSIPVTAATVGSGTNVAVAFVNGQLEATASAPVTVLEPVAPTITKAFFPAVVLLGGVSQLTFLITNPATVTASDISFTDPLPSNVRALLPGTQTVCSSGSLTVTNDLVAGSMVTLTGLTLAAGASCRFTVPILAITPGSQTNATTKITAAGITTGQAAQANITVVVNDCQLKQLLPRCHCRHKRW